MTRSCFRMQDFVRRFTVGLCIVLLLGAAFVMVEFFSITSFTSRNQMTVSTEVNKPLDWKSANRVQNSLRDKKEYSLPIQKSIPKHEQKSISVLKKPIDVIRYTAKPNVIKPAPTHYVTVNFEGRLGNQVFEFASLFGIAKHNNLIPIIPSNALLRRIFKITVGNTKPDIKHTKRYHEKKGCTFEPALMSMGESENLWIKGYLQSYKYFQHAEKELREQYTFQDHIAQKAKSTFQTVIATKKSTPDTVYVAVHVRRGDMKNNQNFVKYGYTIASLDYINKAMNTFRKDFKNLLFVVGSDDLKWCKENLKEDDTVFIPPGSSPEMDVAILTNCNHTVVTVGSYGWWTAWLINGKTIYYKGFPTPNSNLAALFKAEDYYLPGWIPM
ncbi:galactoside alpha-(1,2)-fucosyltransferase 2-like isoform X2 [Ostrea edulis]|uniref:galactoside alpha-(1,2)-fucosyltransferase 2-like isoform X2 n=1 Tax=Ostrea edulis TaxID=37623 RepID=UPI0020941F1C|nr:galactoside alpha-(1,2)-fucosyltransferase 2-like isoform X2 [Ostrea edulis]XP_048731287.1 galactoside alpha-(1,2)-fucosyltransferase 2-like isoform X2 [Ostrea edulis]XP_048731297.1 galactoside alpha-(1,2)-fucosyltransferase 2-like isoform X2 [Ostrea edulis]XP_048731306.1 galactoside alpha-(1,2)-fucosyltransferase 2-like isoform X2 [Ostrea edulis]